MAVELFKRDESTGKIISQLFPVDRFRANMESGGWVLNPDVLMMDLDFGAPPAVTVESDDQLRKRARDAGISNWWNKKPETLLEELNNGLQTEGQEG